MIGKRAKCPECKNAFQVPGSGGSPPPHSSPPPPFAGESIPPMVKPAPTSPRRKSRSAVTWLDLFDWRLEKYLTPWIIRVTWMLTLLWGISCVCLIGLGAVMAWLPEPAQQETTFRRGNTEFRQQPAEFVLPDVPDWLDYRIARSVVAVTAIFVVIIAVLWTRVVLELVMVFFNMASSLNSIDQKTPNTRSDSS